MPSLSELRGGSGGGGGAGVKMRYCVVGGGGLKRTGAGVLKTAGKSSQFGTLIAGFSSSSCGADCKVPRA